MSIFTHSKHLKGMLASLLLSLTLVLTGCGSGGNSATVSTPNNPDNGDTGEQGQVMLSLTDAEGDFLTYVVDVTAISLTHRNGSQISLLPQSTRVDFAQYVDTSELLSLSAAPAGVYRSASITLDFSDAEVTVQDELGNPIVAELVDGDGAPLTETTLNLSLNGSEHFVLSPRLIAHITLDFDLDASNSIDIDGENATVSVNPVLVADTLHTDNKPLRLRGLLADVDQENQQLAIELRPFRMRNGDFGDVTVQVSDTTEYEINGELYSGSAGLAQMASLAAGESLVLMGSWNRERRQFSASDIKAGSSVAWDDADLLRGTVVARSGNTLSVRGAMVEMANAHFMFNDTLTLTVADTTLVSKYGAQADTSAISVGSFVQVAGEMISDTEMDASNGILRIAHSKVSGRVVQVDEQLAIDVALINGRRAALFDFAGTGSSAELDADPTFYEVDELGISIGNISVNDPVRMRGYVADFGSAPADFIAHSIASAANVRSHLVVNYGWAGSDSAIAASNPEGLLLDLSDAIQRHHLISAGIAVDLLDLESMPLIVPANALGIYTIAQASRIDLYLEYTDFAAALDEKLAAGSTVVRFDAHGYFQREENQFEAQRLLVTLSGE